MVDPATGLLIFVITGIGGVVTYSAFHYAEKAGTELKLSDLRPAAPWEGLPLPVFFYTKPKVLQELRGK